MEYKDLKQKVLGIAKVNRACADEYKKALEAKNRKQLLKVIKDNISWCCTDAPELISIELLDAFTEKLCHEFGIYYKGEVKEIRDRKGLVFLNDFKVEMLGNSTVTEMWGNSTVTEMWDNSIARSYNGNRPETTGSRYCYIDLRNNKVYLGTNLSVQDEQLKTAP